MRLIYSLLVFSFCLVVGCQKGAKEIIKEGSTIVGRQTTKSGLSKTSEKLVGKELLEETIKKAGWYPTGRASLKVKEVSPNKWVPEFNNLGPNAIKYSNEVNSKVLGERRKAIAPYMQFPTKDNLNNIDPRKMLYGKPASGTTLEKNMLASMSDQVRKIVNAFGGKEAHHIVEGTDPFAAKSRDIFKRFNIDINDPVNGIFLPTDKQSIFKGTLHKTSHTKEYSEFVYDQLKNCKNRTEVIDALHEIKYQLYKGEISLEGALHSINKNAF